MKLSPARRVALQQAADKFNASLDEAALGYLAGRGITEEMANERLLGLVSVDTEPVYAEMVGRLAIPYLTPSGVVSIRFRCIEDHDCKEFEEANGFHKKYMQMKGSDDHLYNVAALHERHPAIGITEGEFDAAITDEHVLPCVGVPGATKWRPYWGRLFEDFDRVFVIGDGDPAGRKFVDKLVGILPNAHPVMMPADQDPNSYFVTHGADALTGLILGEMQ